MIITDSTASGEIVDIYDAAGLPKPSLSDLGLEYQLKAQQASNPHLAIEASRDLLVEESGKVTRHNLVRQRAFSERIKELMNKYTNQQLTSAEVIAELIELANEVAGRGQARRAVRPAALGGRARLLRRGEHERIGGGASGRRCIGTDARELVAVMQRDVKTDRTVRDDVRAKLRLSIKRLLVKHKYPPDKQPEAIELVIEQMESTAPRYATY